jgi:hypothetical protein
MANMANNVVTDTLTAVVDTAKDVAKNVEDGLPRRIEPCPARRRL